LFIKSVKKRKRDNCLYGGFEVFEQFLSIVKNLIDYLKLDSSIIGIWKIDKVNPTVIHNSLKK